MNADALVKRAVEAQRDLTEFLREAKPATAEVRAAADQIRDSFKVLAKRDGVESVDDLMTGDPIADRRTLETAKLVAAMGATIDWSALPAEAFKIAKAMGPALKALALLA